MTHAQRIYLIMCLLVFASLLHFNLCNWDLKGTLYYGGPSQSQSSIWTKDSSDPTTGLSKPVGLFGEPGLDGGTVLIWGVFLPLGLIAADVFLLIGMRRQYRHAHGLCEQCGYSMQGLGDDIRLCPECGTPRHV